MFGNNTDIVTIIDRFNTQNLFLICKFHNNCWKFFEGNYQFFLDFFDTILIGEKYKMMIVKMKCFGKYDFPFKSEMFVEIDSTLFHNETSKIFESLNN